MKDGCPEILRDQFPGLIYDQEDEPDHIEEKQERRYGFDSPDKNPWQAMANDVCRRVQNDRHSGYDHKSKGSSYYVL